MTRDWFATCHWASRHFADGRRGQSELCAKLRRPALRDDKASSEVYSESSPSFLTLSASFRARHDSLSTRLVEVSWRCSVDQQRCSEDTEGSSRSFV